MTQEHTGPIVRLAELEIDPDQMDSYRTLLSEEIEASIALEPGVLVLYAVADKGTRNKVRVFEIYANQAAYEEHLATPHFIRYKTLTADMVRSLRLIETDPIVLRDKGGTV
jgi:quinol monooxygenase YgiN